MMPDTDEQEYDFLDHLPTIPVNCPEDFSFAAFLIEPEPEA